MRVREFLQRCWLRIAGAGCRIERWRRAAPPWFGIAALAVAAVVLVWFGRESVPNPASGCPENNIVDLEFAGTDTTAHALYDCFEPATLERIPRALLWDSLLIVPLYVLALGWGSLDGARRFRSTTTRAVARAVAGLVVVAGMLDWIENLALWGNHSGQGRSNTWAVIALAATLPKWTILAVAVPVALAGASLAIRRRNEKDPPTPLPAWPDDQPTQWERNFAVDDIDWPAGTRIGLCSSGGGIRSASFNLGVLQVLQSRAAPGRERPVLKEAEHLTAVSGGAYLAAGWQLLAAQRTNHVETDPLWKPDVFSPGSLEEDHLRRNGRYLADSVSEWILAGSRALVGLVLNLAVLVGLLFIVGRLIGWVQGDLVFPGYDGKEVPSLSAGHWIAFGATAALAIVVVICIIVTRPPTDGSVPGSASRFAWATAAAFGALSATLLFVLIVAGFIPRWIELAFEALTGGEEQEDLKVVQTTVVSLTAVGTPAVLGVLTFKGRSEKRAAKRAAKLGTVPAQVSRWRPAVEKYAPRLLNAVLALTAIVLLALFIDGAAGRGPRGEGRFLWFDSLEDWTGFASVGVIIAALWLVTDQTSWSLHPIYKRRLATAFAIQRTTRGTSEYPYSEPTTLSEVLKRVEGFPAVTICAAANVSGNRVPAAGRKAVSLTFDGNLVGNPRIGYVPSSIFEQALHERLRGDSTLLAAMAISGAAFASAMGRTSQRWVSRLLAVVNARLGVWLPSPGYVAAQQPGPVPVKRRGIGYLLREIFGLHDPDDPFLYLTDGGHWENLGLVEVLRRRCNYVVCIDGSGDDPATLGTLAEAMELAYEELGVTISFDAEELDALRPGSAPADAGGARALVPRLSAKAWAVADLEYPALPGVVDRRGKLVYMKALLTPGLPTDIERYAANHARFPNEPTGDQWFSADQQNAYLRLGRMVASAALAEFPR